MRNTFIFALACIALLASCKKKSDYTPNCAGAAKSWVNDVKPIMEGNCTSCHSSFSDYSSVADKSDKIRSKIASGVMPKKGSLTTEQKDKVMCWIDNGTPNN